MSKPIKSLSPLRPVLPTDSKQTIRWARLYGSSRGLALASAQRKHKGLTVVVSPDTHSAALIEQEVRFFSSINADNEIFALPDWETLPYDVFSPHEDIISQRLEALYQLPSLSTGLLIVPITTLMQRIAPHAFIRQHSLVLTQGQRLDRDQLTKQLEQAGYAHVSQVMTHGEFTVRGSIIDLYPMGSTLPYRIDLLDDEVDSIRTFDPEKQTSLQQIDHVRMLPAREFPANDIAIKHFRQSWRATFEGDPSACPIYCEVSKGLMPAGIEYYLPLFFEHTETLFDYLPDDTLFLYGDETQGAAEKFYAEVQERYEQRRHDRERPLLAPEALYLAPQQTLDRISARPCAIFQKTELEHPRPPLEINYGTRALPEVSFHARAKDPADSLKRFLAAHSGRTLFAAESAGRREFVVDILRGFDIYLKPVKSWQHFIDSAIELAITVAPIEEGLQLTQPDVAVITEAQIFGERAQQQRRRKSPTRDADNIIRNLSDLMLGAPIVHEEHGIGRYLGLQVLEVGGTTAEFLALEYSGGDKLYVPVSSLHLVNRYTGATPENAPLHRLGGEQWQKIKRRAAEKARDAAAELLDIHTRRAAKTGFAFDTGNDEYTSFASAFPFEETPDQETTIHQVLEDMASPQPMDRVVCGDVGFGKTEVAMRAAFIAVQNDKQVVVMVPTTLLTQQHLQTFRDRFADLPVHIEALSRFVSAKQQKHILNDLSNGRVDIIIGTHKLVQPTIKFKNLGLAIIDEEHRFGVQHKERFKSLRSEIDLLTLTATPIPRTLNMSLGNLRDLSIIATPPVQRHAIKTFVSEWNDVLIQEACQRELKRGGQVYFLHNKVETIEKTAQQIRQLLPNASINIAHGQMRERELEQVMLDFYHQRFNILISTTIIESGIDVPSANTIIINRADKLGLSQLHQLRGRVGRSHHRAFAYLFAPPKNILTPEAVKRLEAIESLEDLGVGFTLATHDLEIRGAGELLGEDQSGQIQEIGFSLYNELLDRAVKSLRAGQIPNLDTPLDQRTEVDLSVPTLLPDNYVLDVHARLILYKRIASAEKLEELRQLKVEIIDRFGLLPEPAQNLFEVTQLKLIVTPLGIAKVEVGSRGGNILFGENPKLDIQKLIGLIQRQPDIYKLEGQQKLKFFLTMDDLGARIEAIMDLTNTLALKQAA